MYVVSELVLIPFPVMILGENNIFKLIYDDFIFENS